MGKSVKLSILEKRWSIHVRILCRVICRLRCSKEKREFSLCWFCHLLYWKKKCKNESLKVLGTGSNKDVPPLIFRVESFVDFKLLCPWEKLFHYEEEILRRLSAANPACFYLCARTVIFLLWDSKWSLWMFMEACVWGCEINLSWYLPVLWKRQNMSIKHYNAKTCI